MTTATNAKPELQLGDKDPENEFRMTSVVWGLARRYGANLNTHNGPPSCQGLQPTPLPDGRARVGELQLVTESSDDDRTRRKRGAESSDDECD